MYCNHDDAKKVLNTLFPSLHAQNCIGANKDGAEVVMVYAELSDQVKFGIDFHPITGGYFWRLNVGKRNAIGDVQKLQSFEEAAADLHKFLCEIHKLVL